MSIIFKEKKYLLSRPCAECDRSYSEIYNTFVRKKPPLSVPGHTVFADTNGWGCIRLHTPSSSSSRNQKQVQHSAKWHNGLVTKSRLWKRTGLLPYKNP